MEREQYYERRVSHYLPLQYIRPTDEDVLSKPAYVAPTPTTTTKTLSTDLLKPTIVNTGIYFPPVEQPKQAIPKPVDATSPLILAPNIPGGMIVEKPSPVNTTGATKFSLPKLPPAPLKEAVLKLPTLADLKPTAGGQTAKAGFTMPSMYMIIGMIAAVIALMYLARKKK